MEVRALKIIGITVGGVVGLIVIVLLAVWLFVNPNDYKGRIAKAVKDSTGRELNLPGDIKLSIFPWIALQLGPARLGNPPGFGAEPFAAIQHIDLRVKLLPLLHKQLHIGRIKIEGLDLRLHKNAAGKGNWQNLSGDTAAPESATSGTGTLPDLVGVVIKDSRVSYQDLIVDHLNLDVGHVASGIPVQVKLKFSLTTSRGAQPIELAGQFDLTLDVARKKYRFAPLDLNGTITPHLGAGTVPWKFSAPDLSLDLAAQTLSTPAFTAQLASAHLTGSTRATAVIDAPRLTGVFKLDAVPLRELMGQLSISPPKTRDAKTLTKLAANGEFAYGNNAVGVTKLQVLLDESALRGSAITNLDTKAMSCDLVLDHIDLDRYRSPDETSAKTATVEKPAAHTDALKTLQLSGKFAIGSATVSSLTLTEVRASVLAKGGLIRIWPATAKLYGGDYSGDVTLDDRGANPALKLDQSLTGVDVAQLLKDFAKSKRLSGRGTVTTNLTANGAGSEALIKSLSGRIAANLNNGAVEGVDLWFEINRAIALIQKQAMPAGQSSGHTKFDTFKASADLTNGIASTKDLNIASQNLRVTGQGTTNLVTEAINYQVTAKILKDVPTTGAASSKALADIPVTITGTMTNPNVRPDLEGIAKARVQQEFEKHKGELQQKVKDKLKDLLK
jgi:AsmA protein